MANAQASGMPDTGKSREVIDTGVSQLTILIRWCYGCDGQESKIRMQTSGSRLSGMSISNSGQKIRTGR